MDVNDSPQAKAIKEALWAFGQSGQQEFMRLRRNFVRIGINRPTWERLDEAARMWIRVIRPDPYVTDISGHSIAGMAWYANSGKHRITKLRNVISGEMCELEEDVHLPDGMVELIYELSTYREAGHMVDITPLLEVGKDDDNE